MSVDPKDQITIQTSSRDPNDVQSSESPSYKNGDIPQTVTEASQEGSETRVDEIEGEQKGLFSYFRTKEFYITLILG